MHAQSSALKDPIHGAFYRNVMGDPTQEDLRTKDGKYPVCLKCHAPVAAMEKKTKLDAADAYADGVGCTTCHSFSGFKGSDTPDGKPLYGIDAYEVDTQSLHGPSGITYTQERTPEGASWPTPVNHPQPMSGNKAELFKSNDICMGCHEKRANAHGTPLCRTGDEYRADKNFVACQACHMAMVTVPKMKDGQVVPGEFVTIADHTMAGGHDDTHGQSRAGHGHGRGEGRCGDQDDPDPAQPAAARLSHGCAVPQLLRQGRGLRQGRQGAVEELRGSSHQGRPQGRVLVHPGRRGRQADDAADGHSGTGGYPSQAQ